MHDQIKYVKASIDKLMKYNIEHRTIIQQYTCCPRVLEYSYLPVNWHCTDSYLLVSCQFVRILTVIN